MTAGRWKNSRSEETKQKRKKAKMKWADNRKKQLKRSKAQRRKYK